MSLDTSTKFKEDLKTRRMFGNLSENMQTIGKLIGDLLELAATMRTTLGTAMLTLAEVEALYVDNTHERRKADALLAEAAVRLGDLTAKTSDAVLAGIAVHKDFADKLNGVQTQAQRITTDRFVHDGEKSGPLPGVPYVGIDYFMKELNRTRKVIDRLLTNGSLPEHDAVDDESGGRPKFLWAKHKAVAAVAKCLKNETLFA